MGIFDDAIRQHLDLKRRQGADESELKQLEDEAFGLPTRPGEPDFPKQDRADGEQAADGGSQAEVSAPASPTEAPAAEPERPEPEAEPGPEPKAEPAPEPDDLPPHGDALLADPEAKPAPPPEDRPVEDEGAAAFTTAEREAIAEQPTEFFDQAPAELELGELDLDLDEEIEEVGELEEEPLTDEQLAEEASEERPAEPEPAPPPAEEEPPAEASADEPASEEAPVEGEDAEAEDVLEETPEFLRDNPDDDELWFEQGRPKDFDF